MTEWEKLEREVQQWQALDLRLPLWWRDDDAIAPTPQLDRLRLASEQAGVPVHLAIIPAQATAALADVTQANAHALIPVVHGWSHTNHAPEGKNRSEFGTDRPGAQTDAARALARMHAMFGAQVQPIFVPPWNRVHPNLMQRLPALGYRAVSTFTPRRAANPVPGLLQINTHLDPVDWHGTRGLADPDGLIAGLCKQLEARRLGSADASEPFGLLTHHLIHDEDVWSFCRNVLEALAPISIPLQRLLDVLE